MGQMISFKRPDGKALQGYLAEPSRADASAPGLVVIQEWWGLNPQIKGVADRFAAAGYRALVPDLYRGQSTVEAAEAEHLMKGLDFGDAAGQDVRGAVQFLKAGGGAAGVTGFCMGGALTVLSMVHVPEADAGVSWYGYPPLEYVDAAKVRAPLMGHFGLRDVAFAIEGVDALEQKLKDAGAPIEFHRYDCKHAFANETQVGEGKLEFNEYDPDAAEKAWQRTLEFFGRHLKK